ncbi:MAG TPA: magnesium/cobalt transporter CorA [Anaerohalosphaeraceae bacterium]|nr:magnesium/cobalt transporter CorA [Anaerohalosphaeraceae bacterium]HQG06064.1 magnesium/cobalt transporter CorA [Anaerohalosphaeraceae bacterium]HQI07521.1 magnesium/cobalt transporter CorA [Anaerohalosphaeraceae bacterium]HQJ67773.1 magnesium/cobalt transporter CorA [Anaerohalosphaeraceae bacterium]
MAGNKSLRRSRKAGLPPGTLIHAGDRKPEKTVLTVFVFGPGFYEEQKPERLEDCFKPQPMQTVRWINIDGLADVSVIEGIGRQFGVHPLILEDILSTGQRPKCDDSTEQLFVVLRMLQYDDAHQTIQSEQVSILLGPNYVVSFQESVGDVFDPIREQIRTGRGRIRSMGPDYLMYRLMDAIVDGYFLILEKLGERVEALEQEVISEPEEETLNRVYALKQQLIYLRKSVWPLREVISQLEKTDSPLITDATGPYFRDVYDHTIQVMDSVETFRDTVSGLLEIYLNSISNQINTIMKVLTVITTIFIPLSFIAGVYGMNFKYMPELQWRWGYPAVLCIMGVIFVSMLIYFKKNKWL